MKIKLSSEAKRAVFRLLVKASLARHMARFFTEQGDMFSARRESFEVRNCLYEARRIVNREEFEELKKRTTETLALLPKILPVGLQDESSPEPVFAPAAFPRVSVRGVLGQRGPSAAVVKPLLRINLLFCEDGDATITLNRCEFPPLGKHWAPPKVMEAYKSSKGHAFCRA